MPSGIPAFRTSRTSRTPLLALALALPWLMAATCDTLEFVSPVELDTRAGRQSVEVRQPTLGRLGADITFINEGGEDADVELIWVTRTSGSQDNAACNALEGPASRRIDSPYLPGGRLPTALFETLPVVRELDTRLLLGSSEAPPDDDSIFVGFRLNLQRSSEWRLHLPAGIEPEVRAPREAISREALRVEPSASECTDFDVHTWELEAGPWLVRLPLPNAEERIPLLWSEECERARRVPRTCPGARAETRRFRAERLGPGEQLAASLDEESLGIGDVVDLTLRCVTEGCRVRAKVHLRRSPIDCIRLADCAGSETCTSDGHCRLEPEGRGCAQGAGRSSGGAGLMTTIVLLSLLALRRTAAAHPRCCSTRSPGVRVMLVFVMATGCTLLASEEAHASDPLGPHTYLQFGSGVQLLTGSTGDRIAPGIGFHLTHGIQFSPIGVYVDIRRAFHLSTAEPPPFDTGVQHSRLAFGVRSALVLGPGRALAGVEYARFNFLTNPLTETIPRRGTMHGAGANLAYRLELMLPLFAELSAGVASPFGAGSGGAHVNLGLSLGVAGSLR